MVPDDMRKFYMPSSLLSSFFQHPQNEGMEHLTKIVGEYLTEPNSKVKAEDLVWTELDISISQK